MNHTSARAMTLPETPTAYRVEAGEALLFRVEIAADGATGPRRYLLSMPVGATLCHAGVAGLILVPGPGCVVTPRPIDSVRPAELDDWIVRIEATLADDLPPGPPLSIERAEIASGQVLVGPTQGVRWVRASEGSLSPLGMPASSEWLPVTEPLWLVASGEPVRVEVRLTSQLTPDERLAGLRRMVLVVLEADRQRERTEREMVARRTQRREEQLQRDTVEAVGRLVRLIEPGPLPLPPADQLLSAMTLVGREADITFRPAPDDAPGDPIEAIARTSRVRFRRLQLRGEWWRDDLGPLLGFRVEGEQLVPVAFVRRGGGYEMIDPRDSVPRSVTIALAAGLALRAYQFYPPFPMRTLSLWELPAFAIRPFVRELFLTALLTLATTLLGLVLPIVTGRIIDTAIPQASRSMLVELGLLLLATYFGQALFTLTQGYVGQRLYAGSTVLLQAATWDRLLHLSLSFFQRFSSGDLLKRVMLVTEVSQHINSTMLRSLLSGTLSLLYLGLLFAYSATLAGVALVLAILTAMVTVILALAIRREALPLTLIEGRNFGFLVQLIQGVAKLRVAGAEQRAFNRWATRHEQQLRHVARIRLLEDVDHLILFVLPLLGTLVLYSLAVPLVLTPGPTAMSIGTMVAFFATYGMFTEGLSSVSTTLVDVTDVLAKQVLLQPILSAEPETLRAKSDPGTLQGQVAVRRVSYRYSATGPLVLDEVSLEARPGEFIAIVGPSGSGKSTLIRMLLGFDPPMTGQVLYDGQNLGGLDLIAVRKQMGTVLQSSYLFAGPLFENIAAGQLVGPEQVLAAVQEAGLAEDVQAFPMGLHTMLAEGGFNLSGGQRQRVLLARALVGNPRILILDEATSALDNRTQSLVSENLAKRRVTRIVIAHRLSTIRRADRIFVMDRGRVVQAGSFDELLETEGLFLRLMERQLLGRGP